MKAKMFSKTPTKIGIIGPKNVGKTALASLLNGHLKSLGVSCDLVHESARYCPLPLNKETSIDSAYWLLGSQIANEAFSMATRLFTICDRTVIDLYPFTLYALETKVQDGRGPLDDIGKIRAMKTLIRDYLTARPYNFLFYTPIRRELWQIYSPPDDPAFQAAIDEKFREFLNELKVDFYELKALDTYDRLEEIIMYIQENQAS